MPRHHTSSSAEKYISKPDTARRFNKNPRTIKRWVNDPELNFPQPLVINGRWYFEINKLDEFDRRLAAERLQDLARRHQAKNKLEKAQIAGDVA